MERTHGTERTDRQDSGIAFTRGQKWSRIKQIRKEAYKQGYETVKHECDNCRKVRTDEERKLIKKAFDKGYKKGFSDAVHNCHEECSHTDETYQKGLSDAWEAARKIYGSATKHGLPIEAITEIFREKDFYKGPKME